MVPFPIFTIKGRLRLSGLSDNDISRIMHDSKIQQIETEGELLNQIRESLGAYQPSIRTNFDILTRYESLRGDSIEIPALVVVIEGASATGKSLIALELMHDLTATRFISTDSVRQVLRGIFSEEKYPELFCHTYQAYIHRQSGSPNLEPIVRGFLAQCEIITPHVETMTKRIVSEGAIAVVEGVHIQPGSIQGLCPGVIEVLINPDFETHKAMFASKHAIGKLRTVTDDTIVRNREFEATRLIQEYMMSEAEKTDVSIIPFTSYDEARKSVSALVISRVRKLLNTSDEEAVKL
ncbi:MAG: hypothetical protein AM325_005020 [Candidatus Thorarchaeota archaeon SMTZ1-45]|nr:MAG: hypothetical protein AM325_06785 [Candidatus Thorarchaeota archaeon SMTZ1-45]